MTTLDGSWTVAFDPKWGGPSTFLFDKLKSWSDSDDPGVKYFSGTANYMKTINIPAAALVSGTRIVFDLGDVRDVAQVSVNGKSAGILWHAPYRVDVTDMVHAGDNSLELKITNLWVNRLIGDKQPGAKQYTFAPQSPYEKDSTLLPSGLLGPVRVLARR